MSASTNSTALDHDAEITLVLKMKPAEFVKVQAEFLRSLTGLLQVDLSEIEITRIRPGCTKVTLRTSGRIAARILKVANSNESASAETERFVAEFLVEKGFFSEHEVLVRRGGREFTWLHLSDAHWEAADDEHAGSQDRVKKALLDDLGAILKNDDLSPDAVFVTGDISKTGQTREFDAAHDFFSELREKLPNRSAPFMFVPGNHDVDRGVVKRYPREESDAKTRLDNNEHIVDYLTAAKFKDDRDRVFARTENYVNFIKKCSSLGQPSLNHNYFFTNSWGHDGVTVGVAGMNSAWRCGSDADRGNLILGICQIDRCVSSLHDADLRILLLHHPVESDWFIYDDIQYQRAKLGSFDFILRGHEHDPHGSSLSQLHSEPNYRFSAGALYTHEKYPKSFNTVRVNLDHRSARIFYWRLSRGKMEWVRDLDFHRDGSIQFPLTESMSARIANRPRQGQQRPAMHSHDSDEMDRPSP